MRTRFQSAVAEATGTPGGQFSTRLAAPRRARSPRLNDPPIHPAHVLNGARDASPGAENPTIAQAYLYPLGSPRLAIKIEFPWSRSRFGIGQDLFHLNVQWVFGTIISRDRTIQKSIVVVGPHRFLIYGYRDHDSEGSPLKRPTEACEGEAVVFEMGTAVSILACPRAKRKTMEKAVFKFFKSFKAVDGINNPSPRYICVNIKSHF